MHACLHIISPAADWNKLDRFNAIHRKRKWIFSLLANRTEMSIPIEHLLTTENHALRHTPARDARVGSIVPLYLSRLF